MPRKRPTFTQADLTRALKGVTAAGVKVGRVSIEPDGRIDIVFAADEATSPKTALEAWMVKRDAR